MKERIEAKLLFVKLQQSSNDRADYFKMQECVVANEALPTGI